MTLALLRLDCIFVFKDKLLGLSPELSMAWNTEQGSQDTGQGCRHVDNNYRPSARSPHLSLTPRAQAGGRASPSESLDQFFALAEFLGAN